jgi:hypothetical protein
MLHYSFRLLPFLFLICSSALAQLSNNGSLIQINGNALVQINGDFTNEAGSNYVNYGSVIVLGNFTNNQVMSSPYSGMLRFDGTTGPQTVSGASKLWANDIEINNASGIIINDTLLVDGEISFINGILSATNASNPFWLSSTATISSINPPSDASHVRGYMVREGTGNFSYPLGDGTKYQKIDLNLSSNTAGMRVRYDSSSAGAAPYVNTGSDTTPLFVFNNLEYWDCTPLGTATGTVQVYWDSYKNGGTTFPNDLRVAHKSGGNWLNEGTIGVGTSAAGSVTSNSLSTWSPFTLGSTSFGSPLPINLLGFNGKVLKEYNQLIWFTGIEEPNTNFELERSINGKQFNKIARIAAQGNNNNEYRYNDFFTEAGDVFYRLRIINTSGKLGYSNTVKLNRKDALGLASSLFPNPAEQLINIAIGDQSLIGSQAKLYDMSGKLLQSVEIKTGVQQIDINQYPAAQYIIRLENDESLKFNKIQ